MELEILQQILNKFDKLESKIDNLEAGQQKLESKLDKLEAGQQEMRYDIRALKLGQEKLEAGQEKLEAGQEKLEADITGMKADITIIKKDTARIPYVEQAALELSQADKGVQKQLQKHEATLDALSAKRLG